MSRARCAAALAACVVLLAGCAADGSGDSGEVEETRAAASTEPAVHPLLQQAKTKNQSRHVAEKFPETPVVLDDPFGFEAAELFFDASEVLILSDAELHSQLRAASVAVVAHAPMVIYNDDHHAQVIQEIERLGARTVFAVGDVPVLNYTEDLTVIRDPGGLEALEKATALKFTEKQVARPEDAAAAVAQLSSADPVWLRAGFEGTQTVGEDDETGVVPLQSRQDAEMAPSVIAAPSSPLPGIATARAYGASVSAVQDPDPRRNVETMLATVGLADKPLVALGREFGTPEELSAAIVEAERTADPAELDKIETLPQSADAGR